MTSPHATMIEGTNINDYLIYADAKGEHALTPS